MNNRLNRTEQPSKNTRNLLVATREREINKEGREKGKRETYSYASSDYTQNVCVYVCMYVCMFEYLLQVYKPLW